MMWAGFYVKFVSQVNLLEFLTDPGWEMNSEKEEGKWEEWQGLIFAAEMSTHSDLCTLLLCQEWSYLSKTTG